MTGTRSWVLAGMLAFCAAAAADVRVFVTNSASGYGLDLLGPDGDGTGTDPAHENWPIDPFRPTYSTVDSDGSNHYACDYYYGYYRVGAYPPIDAPSGTIDNPILINAAAGEWAYIWFQFRDEPREGVNWLDTVATLAGQSQPTQSLDLTYYVQNDYYNPDHGGMKRWAGEATAPGYPEWHSNPQHVWVYDGGDGIDNRADDPEMMFHHQAGTMNDPGWTGVALLGAVRGAPSDAVYELRATRVAYGAGYDPGIGESTYFQFVPEPSALLLVALGTAVIGGRKRRP